MAELEEMVHHVHPLAQQVSDALLGAVFPLWRGQLVRVARENEAPATLLTLLSQLPDVCYPSLAEVQEALDEPASERLS